MPADTARISPTAYYTGHVWCRNGLSDPALDTREGAALFMLAQPVMRVAKNFTGGVTLEDMLLQRHRVIDHLLARAIEEGRVHQVLEIAGGMSGRGIRFTRRYADRGLVYVEGDLPAMAARKRSALERVSLLSRSISVVDIDVLHDDGPRSIASATASLFDRDKGTAIVTEGLLNYFDLASIRGMWERFARFLRGFPSDLYLADVYLEDSVTRFPAVRGFRRLLETFTRGRTHLHFGERPEVVAALAQHGFDVARVHRPRELADVLTLPAIDGPDVVHLIEASTR